MTEKIDFGVIPGTAVALQIYLPGTFFGSDGQFHAFVGGCGVGRAKTLRAAKQVLLKAAMNHCQNHIDDATAKLELWEAVREELKTLSLGRGRKVEEKYK